MRESLRVASLIGASLWLAHPALAGERSAGSILYDVVVERPFGVAETALGLGVATIAYPLSLGSGRSSDVLDRCVTEPARRTFTRSLGDFRQRARSRCSAIGLGFSLSRMVLGVLGRPLDLLFGPSPLSPDRHSADELEAAGPERFHSRAGGVGA